MPYKNKEDERKRSKRRRLNPLYLEYQKNYQNKWRKKNKDKWKQIQKKSESRSERKEYRRNWWKGNKAKMIRHRWNISDKAREYEKNWNKQNPEKVKLKGIKSDDKRRKKFGDGEYPTIELIKYIDNRDKVCVYCHCEFDLNHYLNKNYPTYDHLNPKIPHSKINTVKCCRSCNSSKNDFDVLEWLKFRKFNPSPIVLELLEKQKNL